MRSIEAKKTGRPRIPNRQGLYAKVARFAILAIDSLVDLMKNSRNENIRLGAAKTILDKCLPDIKAAEFTFEKSVEPVTYVITYEKNFPSLKESNNNNAMIVNAGDGFVPPNIMRLKNQVTIDNKGTLT